MHRYVATTVLLFTVVFAPTVFAQSSDTLAVSVLDGYAELPVAGALVELYREDQLLATRTTNGNGTAVFATLTTIAAEPIPHLETTAGAAYPNPFHTTTRVPLTLSQPTHLTARVYDITGRHVLLVQQHLPANHYAVEIDLSGLASGPYVLHLQSDLRPLGAVLVLHTGRLTQAGNPSLRITGQALTSARPLRTLQARSDAYQLRIEGEGYAASTYNVPHVDRQGFTAWLHRDPAAVSVRGLVAVPLISQSVPAMASHMDNSHLTLFADPETGRPTSVLYSTPDGTPVVVWIDDDGQPTLALISNHVLFINYVWDGSVDVAVISPGGETTYYNAIGADTRMLDRIEEAYLRPDITLTQRLGLAAGAISLTTCTLPAIKMLGGASSIPDAAIPCTSNLLTAIANLVPEDSDRLEQSAAGYGALPSSGCVENATGNPIRTAACVVRQINERSELLLAITDQRGLLQDAIAEARVELDPLSVSNSIQMRFVRINAGTFQMGSATGRSNERPVHQVTLTRDFYMSQYEVKQTDYLRVTGFDPSQNNVGAGPVENVSWLDAVRFANTLSQKEELPPCYDTFGNVTGGVEGNPYTCTGYRLPTEAEWEHAARAGTTTDYFFGNDPAQLSGFAWYLSNSDNSKQPAGGLDPNPWGIYDIYGNVWEWVYDFNEAYSPNPSEDPYGLPFGEFRTIRGGGFLNTATSLRSTYRGGISPAARTLEIGFRLVRTAR